MIQVTLWTFDKKKNSTKIPTSAGTVYDGELKESFSPQALDVKLNLGQMIAPPFYNYASISWGENTITRYYFITHWHYEVGFWYATMVQDVLATYKTDIGNSIQYVTRSASACNPGIIDTSYPTTGEVVRRGESLVPVNFWGAGVGGISGAEGLVVLGVIGKTAVSVGAVTYYAMSFDIFRAFMQTMLTDISWANISVSEISTELQKALINPTQYIVSCVWFPIRFDSFDQGLVTNTLSLGWWNFTLSGNVRVLNTIGSAWLIREGELDIPKHPQSVQAQGGDPNLLYLNLNPYTHYLFRMPPFGIFELDTTELMEYQTIGFHVDVNLMTGDATLKVAAKNPTDVQYNFEGRSFLVYEAQVGVNLPIGQVRADLSNFKNALYAATAADIGGVATYFGG